MCRRYAIIGAGAVGGYFGARLHHGGFEVHFLLRSDLEHVQRYGLKVETAQGDLSIPQAHAYGDPCALPPCDVVLVCLKTTHNHLLAELLPPAVRKGATVVLMQNGLGSEEAAAQVLDPATPILGGLAFLCCHKVGPGHIRHMDYGTLRFGALDPAGGAAGVTEPLRRVVEDFERAGVQAEVEEDLALARWKKLVWNVPFNGLTVIHNTTTDRLMADPGTRALCANLMREVQGGAAACGRTIPDAFLEKMMADTDNMVNYAPSMKLDFDEGRAMELEAIYANPLRAAEAAGCACPEMRRLYDRLHDLEAGSPDRDL